MKRSTLIWSIVLALGVFYVAFRVQQYQVGRVYVRAVEVKAADSNGWVSYEPADPKERNEPGVSISWPRTAGLWISAFFTLSILSFLYGDNVFYKLAESVLIGVTAAYVVVVGFWTVIVDNLVARLVPDLMRATFLPKLPADQLFDWVYLIPLALSLMLLWRLLPWGGWISRWPVAFFIGATAGFRLVAFFHSDFVSQIQNTILPLVVFTADRSFDIVSSIKNLLVLTGVLSCLVYFFFSSEHKGMAGHVSRVGVWVLMIAFGASFGYTVMGRIALLAERLEFLFDDWLWLIDPALRRVGM